MFIFLMSSIQRQYTKKSLRSISTPQWTESKARYFNTNKYKICFFIFVSPLPVYVTLCTLCSCGVLQSVYPHLIQQLLRSIVKLLNFQRFWLKPQKYLGAKFKTGNQHHTFLGKTQSGGGTPSALWSSFVHNRTMEMCIFWVGGGGDMVYPMWLKMFFMLVSFFP